MEDRIKQTDQDLSDLQKEVFRLLTKSFLATQSEILAQLLELEDEEPDLFTLGTMATSFDSILIQQKDDLKGIYMKSFKDVQEMSIDHQADLLLDFFQVSLEAITLAQLNGSSLVGFEQMVESYLNQFTAETSNKIHNTMNQAYLNKRGVRDIAKILKTQFKSQLNSLASSVQYLTQLVFNHFAQKTLEVASLEKKQWYSVLDTKTTEVCQALDGQVKRIDEPFVDPHSGSEFMYPPAVWGNPGLKPMFHWCRSVVIPYRD